MKIKALVLAAMVVSSGFIAQTSHAATVGKHVALNLVSDGEGGFNSHFGNNFTSADTGKNFIDTYTFSLVSPMDSSASLTSTYLSAKTIKDLNITSFDLIKYDTTMTNVLASYTGYSTTDAGAHPTDTWELTAPNLSSGTYFLQVGGKVIGNGGGTYGSDLTVSMAAAVPEPETYGMLMAGLGLMGVVARRRKAKQA